MRISLIPILGSGTSSSQSPGSESFLTRAFMNIFSLAKRRSWSHCAIRESLTVRWATKRWLSDWHGRPIRERFASFGWALHRVLPKTSTQFDLTQSPSHCNPRSEPRLRFNALAGSASAEPIGRTCRYSLLFLARTRAEGNRQPDRHLRRRSSPEPRRRYAGAWGRRREGVHGRCRSGYWRSRPESSDTVF